MPLWGDRKALRWLTGGSTSEFDGTAYITCSNSAPVPGLVKCAGCVVRSVCRLQDNRWSHPYLPTPDKSCHPFCPPTSPKFPPNQALPSPPIPPHTPGRNRPPPHFPRGAVFLPRPGGAGSCAGRTRRPPLLLPGLATHAHTRPEDRC